MTKEEKYWLNRKITNEILYKKCNKCLEWYPETEEYFYMRNKSKPQLGLNAVCKKCNVKSSLKYINEHWDGFIQNVRRYIRNPKGKAAMKRNQIKQVEKGNRQRYRQNNPDKMKQYAKNKMHKSHDITNLEWKSCYDIFNYECAYCGMTLEEHKNKYREQLHKEHVDNKGYLDLRNCVPACKSCNCIKHEMELNEFFKAGYIEKFTKEKYNKIIWWITEGYKDYIEDKPPYRITRKQNDDKCTYHYELWSVDEKRNMVECIGIGSKKKDLNKYIKQYYNL